MGVVAEVHSCKNGFAGKAHVVEPHRVGETRAGKIDIVHELRACEIGRPFEIRSPEVRLPVELRVAKGHFTRQAGTAEIGVLKLFSIEIRNRRRGDSSAHKFCMLAFRVIRKRGVWCRRRFELDASRSGLSSSFWRHAWCRSLKARLTIRIGPSGDWPMAAVQAFQEVNGRDFRAAEKWDRRPPCMSMPTVRASGRLFDVMRPVLCPSHEAAVSAWIACIRMANSNLTTRSTNSIRREMWSKASARRCSSGPTACMSIARATCG